MYTGSPLQAMDLEALGQGSCCWCKLSVCISFIPQHADNDLTSWDTAKVALARAAYGREAPGLKCRSLQSLE